jgi:DNA primase large subunit
LQNIFINYFPFSKLAAEYLQKVDIDIRTLPTSFPNPFKEAYERLLDLIDKNIIPEEVDTSPTSSEVIIYAIMRVFIEILNEDLLRNRFAEAYSKRTGTILLSKKDSSSVLKLASSTFEWELKEEVHIGTRTYNWMLRFINFLEVAPRFMANDWKLINQDVQKGWVLLTKEKIIRLLAEQTKIYILKRRISHEELPKLPEIYDSYLTALKSKINELRAKFDSQRVYSDQILKSAYPPCVNGVLEKTEKGENLAHPERLFITFFLLNIGHSVSDVVDIFRNQPDFKEEMTRYQVEFSAGQRGSGTKYTSFGCPKLLTFGICRKESDLWCRTGIIFKKPLKNPLHYYSAKIFVLNKEKAKQKAKS